MRENFKHWLGWLALVLIFSASCVWLSEWQFNRRTEAVDRNLLIENNYDQAPVNLNELISLDEFKAKNEWRSVKINGHFIPSAAVLVRNRPFNGSPGFLQLIPFQIESGKLIAIETGWLPTGSKQDSPDFIPLPKDSQTEIIARVRPTEPTLRDAPTGQISSINVDELIQKRNLNDAIFKSFYARLSNSYNSAEFPKILPKPVLTEGNHLSYALQWILFALMSMFAFGWAIRQEVIRKIVATDPNFVPKKRKQAGDRDKAVEDAILDR